MEMRTRYRAVTAEDFEFLAGEASPRVARAICSRRRDGGAVRVHLVPARRARRPAARRDELTPDEELLRRSPAYLDERRLIGTTVELLPGALPRRDASSSTSRPRRSADRARVEEDVARALYTYLNPLVGGSRRARRTGWEFGRALNQGELFGVVHAVDGRRVREDPARLRDRPRDRRAAAEAAPARTS